AAGSNALDVLSAAKQLGIVDSTEFSASGALLDSTGMVVPGCDSLVTDTTSARRSGCPPYSPTAWTSRYTNADSGRAIFGLDVFRLSTSQFDPNLAGPVDDSYRLGPGDRLMLILTGDVEVA